MRGPYADKPTPRRRVTNVTQETYGILKGSARTADSIHIHRPSKQILEAWPHSRKRHHTMRPIPGPVAARLLRATTIDELAHAVSPCRCKQGTPCHIEGGHAYYCAGTLR